MNTTMDPTSVGLAVSGQHDVVLPTPLFQRYIISSFPSLATVPQQQQPQSKIPSHAYANYAMGTPLGKFSRVEPSPDFICWFLLQCLLSAFRFPHGCYIHK